jgi:hypothetical protein
MEKKAHSTGTFFRPTLKTNKGGAFSLPTNPKKRVRYEKS